VQIFDAKPLIYLITKGDLTPENFREKTGETLSIIEEAVRAQVSLIQIREKSLTAGQAFELVSKAARLTKNSNTRLVVNDRADIARAARADGVHLAANSLPPGIIRAHFGEDFIIGVSSHSPEEVEEAKRAGADFATFSPIFATASKAKYGAPQGVAKLREAVEAAKDFPVIALGGIDESNFTEALRAGGAKGIAAIRLLNDTRRLMEIAGKIFTFRNS
jgi:thiamine-phosphate pyrophosphorylase